MTINRRDFITDSFAALLSLSIYNHTSASSAKSEKPNILFCIADDASYPHLSAYGCQWINTPAFDRVARQGIIFTNAYTPNAKCAPSRACVLTGRNSWQLEQAANHLPNFPQKFITYPETLKAQGYHVGYTGKGWSPGNPGTDSTGTPRNLCGTPYLQHKTTPPTSGISSCDYAANFQVFLDDRKDNQPFCFWYGGHEPHRRYEFNSGREKGGKEIAEIDKVFDFWPDNETTRTDLLDYAYEIEYFDSHLQKMLQTLEQRNLLDNTIVVVTADNGMPFPRIKGQEYEYSNHLPLALMWKNQLAQPGRIVSDYVSFIDFAPTFIELADIKPEQNKMQPIQGRSLTDIIYSTKTGQVNPSRDHVLIGKERHDPGRPNNAGYPIRGIVQQPYLYIQNFETDRWPAGNPETGYLNCDGSPTKTVCLQACNKPEEHKYWQWSFGKRPPI